MEIKTYELQPKFQSISFEEEDRIWFGDPCYVVPGWDDNRDMWSELCGKMFHPVTKQHPDTGEIYTSNEYDFDDKNHIRVVDTHINQPNFYMWSTSYGDGTYPLLHKGTKVAELGVDAGCLSMVPWSLIKSWGKEADAERLGHVVTDFSDAYLQVEDGDMFWGDYSLHTGYESQEDEEDEWGNPLCDEESYI